LSKANAKLKLSKPSEAKDVANPFGKSYAQTLRTRFKLLSLVIIYSRLSRRPAEYQQNPPCKRTKKWTDFITNRHFRASSLVARDSFGLWVTIR